MVEKTRKYPTISLRSITNAYEPNVIPTVCRKKKEIAACPRFYKQSNRLIHILMEEEKKKKNATFDCKRRKKNTLSVWWWFCPTNVQKWRHRETSFHSSQLQKVIAICASCDASRSARKSSKIRKRTFFRIVVRSFVMPLFVRAIVWKIVRVLVSSSVENCIVDGKFDRVSISSSVTNGI